MNFYDFAFDENSMYACRRSLLLYVKCEYALQSNCRRLFVFLHKSDTYQPIVNCNRRTCMSKRVFQKYAKICPCLDFSHIVFICCHGYSSSEKEDFNPNVQWEEASEILVEHHV